MSLSFGNISDDFNSLCYGKELINSSENTAKSGLGSHAVTVLGSVFMSLLSLIIIVGNGLIMVSVTVVKQLRQPGNYLIVSLALSDFLVGFIVLPLTIVYDVAGEWVFGTMMCDIHVSFDVICCTASIINICMISIDRYLIITRPLRYRQQRSGKLMACAIFSAWLFSALIIIPALFGFTENVKDAPTWIKLSATSMLEENRLCTQHNANSSVTSDIHCSINAIDGNLSTYWDPGENSKEWHFTVDLKQVYKIQRIGIQAATGHGISIFNLQTEICHENMSENFNETFYALNSTSERQIYHVAKELVARAMRLTIIEASNNSAPRVMEFLVYGEKLIGKTCLISQEVWFTIYSTLGAFYIPLTVMLCMYWKIYVEATRFNARYQDRSNSYSTTQSANEKESNSLLSNAPSLVLASDTNPSFSLSEVEKSMNGFLKSSHEDSNPPLAEDAGEPCDHFDSEEIKFYAVKDDDKKLSIKLKEDETISRIYDDFCLNKENQLESKHFPVPHHTDRKFSIPTTHYSNGKIIDLNSRSQTFPINKRPEYVCHNSYSNVLPSKNTLHKRKPTLANGNSAVTRFPPISENDELDFCEKSTIKNNQFKSCSARENAKRKFLQSRSYSEASGMNAKRVRRKPFSSTSSPSLSRLSRTKHPLQRSLSSPGRNIPTSESYLSDQRYQGFSRSISVASKYSTTGEDGHKISNKSSNVLDTLRRRVSFSTSSGERKLNMKATRTLGVIIGAFTVCWLPFFIVTFIRPFVCDNPESQDCIPLALVRLVLWLGYVNSALNPIIYIGFSPDLRETFRLLLSCKCANVDRRIAQTELREAISREKRLSEVGRSLAQKSIL